MTWSSDRRVDDEHFIPDSEPPANRPTRAGIVAPDTLGGKRKIGACQRPHAAVGRYEDALIVGATLAVAAPDLEQHETAAIVKLQREPVPADLLGTKTAGTPLPIKPAAARDLDFPITGSKRSFDGDARYRIVVGPGARALRRQSPISLRHRRARIAQDKVDAERLGLRSKTHGPGCRAGRFETPAFDPRGEWGRPHPGEPGMAAREPFRFVMMFAFDIRQREMAEVYLRRAPGSLTLVASHRPAKERELHTVFVPAGRVFEGGGEIPPLLAKTRMGTVVAGKFEGPHTVGSAESRR